MQHGRAATLASVGPQKGTFRPHLHQEWAHPGHICTGAGLTPSLSHLRGDWAHPAHVCTGDRAPPLPRLRRDWMQGRRRARSWQACSAWSLFYGAFARCGPPACVPSVDLCAATKRAGAAIRLGLGLACTHHTGTRSRGDAQRGPRHMQHGLSHDRCRASAVAIEAERAQAFPRPLPYCEHRYDGGDPYQDSEH